MVRTVFIILSHMIAFSIGQLPVVMLILYRRLDLSHRYDFQTMLRVIPISIILIIVSVYKMVYLTVFDTVNPPAFSPNVSLFFGIAFVACLILSIYFIIDRAIVHFKQKSRRLVLNVSAGISILLAIFAIFQMVSQSQENQLNYIDLAINLIYPALTGLLVLASIVSIIFHKKASKNQNTYAIIFLSSIPFIILDLLFAYKLHLLLTTIPYVAYIIVIFVEVLSSQQDIEQKIKDANAAFKEKYELTDREIEVYHLASQGLSNQEISKKLFVSIHTVKSHMQHIFAKLGISTRYQLINFEKEIESDKN